MRNSKNISKPRKPIFSFVVDGECELWYLQKMKENEFSLKMNLDPKIPQKKKIANQYNTVLELAEESVKVFWVVDFDVILKETKEAKKGAKTALEEFKEYYQEIQKKENVTVIVNNPCLEYWFLLHFKQTSKYYETYVILEKSLKKYLPDYDKSEKYYKNSRQDIYQRLKSYLETAIDNAGKIGEFDFANTKTGMAEMYKLFNENEIKEIIESK